MPRHTRRNIVLNFVTPLTEPTFSISGGGDFNEGQALNFAVHGDGAGGQLNVYGDSITEGANASDAAHRWANLVAAAKGWTLRNNGLSGTVLQNSNDGGGSPRANNGRDTYVARLITGANLSTYYCILYGVNDLRYTGGGAFSAANFQNDLGEIVAGLIAAGVNPQKIVLGTPHWLSASCYASTGSPGFTGSNDTVHQAYNAAVLAVATAYGTKFADVYAATRDGGGNALYDTDLLHPIDAGHAVIANTFLAAINTGRVIYVPGETISLDFTAQATPSPAGTWNYSGLQMLSNAVAALNLATPGSATINGQTITFNMNVWNGTINFVRQSFNNSAEQGDFAYSWTISNPTRGTISGSPTISGTIADLFGAPPTGLTGLAFSSSEMNNGARCIFIPTTTVANTLLTNVTGVGDTLTSLAFATGGDAGGLVKLVGNSLYSNGTMNFDPASGPIGDYGYGIACYDVTLIGNPGANEIHVQLRINAHFAKIEPTGEAAQPGKPTWNGTSPDIKVYPNHKNFVEGSLPFLKLVVSPSVTGTPPNGGTNGGGNMSIPWNTTTIGHKKFSFFRGGGFLYAGGNNHIFYDVAFRPGGEVAGYPFEDRDCGNIFHGQYFHFKNCSFSWSVDELFSVWGYSPSPRHIRFERCLFINPLLEAGHPKGSHAYGPIVSERCMDVVFDKCVFLGLRQRSPWFSNGRGYLLQNCIIARFGDNNQNGGTFFNTDTTTGGSTSGELQRHQAFEMTAMVRGCLYQYWSPASRLYAIIAANATGIGPYCQKIYLSEGLRNDQCHFFQLDATMGGVPNLANDPLTRAANIARIWLTEEGFACADEPFRTDMTSELMPTDTPANRSLMWNDVINNVGVRNDGSSATGVGVRTSGLLGMTFIDYEVMKRFLETGDQSYEYGQFPNGPDTTPVPGNATYDFAKVTQLPPGAPAWPV